MWRPDLLSVALSFLILAYAGYADIKRRSVSNIPWLAMIALGIPLAVYRVLTLGAPFLLPVAYSLVLTTGLSYPFSRLRLLGSADAKSLICLALIFPAWPSFSVLSPGFPLFRATPAFPFALATLLHASLLALMVPLYLFFHNLLVLGPARVKRDLQMAFIAYRLPLEGLERHRHIRLTHLLYEEKAGALKRAYSLAGMEIDAEVMGRLRRHRQEIGEAVWVTPDLPFLVFITAGFVAAALLENWPWASHGLDR